VGPLDRCAWPPLGEPYATALHEAVRYIFGRWAPVGIVAAGTIIRGHPGPASDLDLHVLHRRPERRRVQRFFNGVPAEIFVNLPERVERDLAGEQRDGRQTTAHMLATGAVVYAADATLAQLRERAPAATPAGRRGGPPRTRSRCGPDSTPGPRVATEPAPLPSACRVSQHLRALRVSNHLTGSGGAHPSPR
jgi:hypothetical protein